MHDKCRDSFVQNPEKLNATFIRRFMKTTHLIVLLIFCCLGCNEAPEQDTPALSVKNEAIESPVELEEVYSEYETYFVVIADTGNDYVALRKIMFELSDELHCEIDTMGRSFNQEKQLISLPEDDDDEMYAGDYFPRRFRSKTLSLEYLDLYVGDKSAIALVTGIFIDEKAADSALVSTKILAPNAFKVRTEMFVGCMH